MKKPSEVIILTRMYAGTYLEENIGHEIINLFKDDNGNNYIYINEDGRINAKYNDSVKAVFLVRYVETGVFEVIAKAEELTQVLYRDKDADLERAEQEAYIKDNEIRYAGVPLDAVFREPGHFGMMITFKAEKVRLPKRSLYLIEDDGKTDAYDNDNHFFLPEKHFSRQSLKMYYPKEDFPNDFRVLELVLNSDDLW